MRFALHEHKAKKARLRYDVRLEWHNGTVMSFAMRYQPPTISEVKRLLIEQPLHDVESLDFEGIMEEGYGAGQLRKIDSGNCDLVKESEKELILVFRGGILKGASVMLNTGEHKWLAFKKKE